MGTILIQKQGHFTEAAMCILHVAAIITEYLSYSKTATVDLSIFTTLFPNLSEVAVTSNFFLCF